MLTELQIANLGVIEHLRIEIGPGLTTLTGETGTGKTVLLGAISLLVGGRAEADLVRPGAQEARVDGRFWLPVSAVPADLSGPSLSGPDVSGLTGRHDRSDPWEATNAIETDAIETGAIETDVKETDVIEIVISRVVPRSGRSRAYINGHPVTVATLAQVTASQVDLHGQHAHQSLLSTQTQRAALDEFGDIDTGTLLDLRARLVASEARRAELGGDERARAREIDLLSFQISEIDEAQISDPEEPEKLALEEEVLADARGHLEAGADALERLTGEGAARDLLAEMARALGDRRPFQVATSRLQDLLAELDDLGAELRAVTEAIEEDPERMEQIRLRRQALRDLCRKYGDDLGEVSRYRKEAAERLRLLSDHEAQAELIDAEIAHQQELLGQESARVRRAREMAAPHLATAVEQGLRSLAMPHARVEIRIAPVEVDPAGDRVEFMLAANPGLESAPLHKVASGGELSRAMLALRLALRQTPVSVASGRNEPVDTSRESVSHSTLIFDEVDAGIGGAAAVAVADALRRLGTQHQVLVVTHLAQVAAIADQHLRVMKNSTDESTVAVVEPVKGQARVEEIARMLSGHHTAAAVRHAKELLSARSAGLGAIHPATASTGLG
jgi:DNA repair protein RecN (Recombination protein N)